MVDMAEEILDLGDVRLCVESFGVPDDPTLLLISGAAESMDGWDPAWCRAAGRRGSPGRRYDHRDTGRSTSSPAGHPSYPGSALSHDALRILDALDVERAHLVGLSMGGGIAQEVAARHPDRVATLTLIATSPAGRRRKSRRCRRPSRGSWRRSATPRRSPTGRIGRPSSTTWSRATARTPAPSASTNLPRVGWSSTSSTGPPTSRRPRKNHWLVAGDEDDGFAMTDIMAPTLVIHGTTDPMFPLAHGEALAREIPDATLVRVPGMGHERPPAAVRGPVTEEILRHTSR